MARTKKPTIKKSVHRVSNLPKAKANLQKSQGVRNVSKMKTNKTTAHTSPRTKPTVPRNSMPRAVTLDSAAQAPRTSFLSLSGELRNIIYNHVLVFDEKIIVNLVSSKKKRKYQTRGAARSPTGVPAFLQVCREIRREGLSIFYSANTFAFHDNPKAWDPHYEFLMILGEGWSRAGTLATHFERWCNALGDNIKWLRKIHLCYSLPEERTIWLDYDGNFLPYVKFAILHPDVSITVAREVTRNCGCTTTGQLEPELAQLADKFPVIKEPGWIEEIKAGNIVGLLAETVRERMVSAHRRFGRSWELKVTQVDYSSQASQQIRDEEDWQELCDKLSLPYKFELVRKAVRGGANFGMVVEAKSEEQTSFTPEGSPGGAH